MTSRQKRNLNMMTEKKGQSSESEVEQYQVENEYLDEVLGEYESFLSALEGSVFQSTTHATGSMNNYDQIENWLEATALEILAKFGASKS